MTKWDLEQLKSLKQEVKQLQDELHNLPLTTDSVTGSDPEFPYVSHTIKIQGVDESNAARLRRKLWRKLDELQGAIVLMEEWLETVPDSETRIILRMKYRNGMKDHQIAQELGYDRSTVSWKQRKFWSEQLSPNSPN